MKNLIAAMLTVLAAGLFYPAYAGDTAQLKLNISGIAKDKHYYLCIYGVGCLNIRASNQGKPYPILPMDMGNITKLVITDIRNMQMYMQPVNASCNVQVKNNQKIIISGDLVLNNNKPTLRHLNCSVL